MKIFMSTEVIDWLINRHACRLQFLKASNCSWIKSRPILIEVSHPKSRCTQTEFEKKNVTKIVCQLRDVEHDLCIDISLSESLLLNFKFNFIQNNTKKYSTITSCCQQNYPSYWPFTVRNIWKWDLLTLVIELHR